MKKNEAFTEAIGKLLEAQAQTMDEAEMIVKSFKPDEETIALNNLYDEFERSSGKQKKALGKKILAQRPDDLDVKLALLYEENLPPRDLLRKIDKLLKETYPAFAKAAELKDDKKDEEDHNLYQILDCRPYLRTLAAKYSIYIQLDEKEEACKVAKKLLYYSPGDNLGIRIKASCLFYYLHDQEAIDFISSHYPGELATVFAAAFDKYSHDQDIDSFYKEVSPFNVYLALYCTGQLYVEDEDFKAANRSPCFRHNSLEEATDYLESVLDSYGNEIFNELVRKGAEGRHLIDFASFVKEHEGIMEVVCPLYFTPDAFENGVSRNYLEKVAAGKTKPGQKRKMFESLLYGRYKGREKEFQKELQYLDRELSAIQVLPDYVYVMPSGAALASTFAVLMNVINPVEDGIASA